MKRADADLVVHIPSGHVVRHPAGFYNRLQQKKPAYSSRLPVVLSLTDHIRLKKTA